MGDAPRLDGVAERARHVVLSHEIVEAHGAPFPGEDDVAHAGLFRVADRSRRLKGGILVYPRLG